MSRENSFYKHKYREVLKAIEDIKAEIRQKQWHIGVDSANQVIAIIDKHAK